MSEVEVGVDRSIFNMPHEVVFVDTPGLKDPVKYRSNITKKYIKKADAVLIALKPGPFTAEGLEIVTTVLDCTDTDKAYIVGTQKDLDRDSDCEKYKSNWIEHLLAAKRYSDERSVRNRIILTSAKMDLLVNKWMSLSDEDKENESKFSWDDYVDLRGYVEKVFRKKDVLDQMSKKDFDTISSSTGIPGLREKLERSLIKNYREIKSKDIEKSYCRCKKQIIKISEHAIQQQERKIKLATEGAEALKKEIEDCSAEKENLSKENDDLKKAVEILENSIRSKIKDLERKEN